MYISVTPLHFHNYTVIEEMIIVIATIIIANIFKYLPCDSYNAGHFLYFIVVIISKNL